MRALARLIKKKIDSKSFERDALKKMIQKMSGMDTSELLNMEQMELRRVDMILGGAILAEECMNLLKAKKMKYLEFSMRDGVLKKETSLFKNNFKVHAPFYMPDLIEKAVRFGSRNCA